MAPAAGRCHLIGPINQNLPSVAPSAGIEVCRGSDSASIMTSNAPAVHKMGCLLKARATIPVEHPAPTRISNAPNRKQAIILTAIAVFLLLVILVSQTAFDLRFLQPGNNQEIVVFAALSALIFLLFAALTFVLGRNLLKLFAERRLGVLGSKFRTRMVVGA